MTFWPVKFQSLRSLYVAVIHLSNLIKNIICVLKTNEGIHFWMN